MKRICVGFRVWFGLASLRFCLLFHFSFHLLFVFLLHLFIHLHFRQTVHTKRHSIVVFILPFPSKNNNFRKQFDCSRTGKSRVHSAHLCSKMRNFIMFIFVASCNAFWFYSLFPSVVVDVELTLTLNEFLFS